MEFKKALKAWNGNTERGAQTRFAQHLGIAPNTVSQWCNGKLAPGEEMLRKIAKAFKISEADATSMFRRRFSSSDSDLRAEVDALREEVAKLAELVSAALHLEKGSLRKT